MGKHIGIRIISCLRSLCVHHSLGQHLSIGGHDLSSHYSVRKRILSGIIGTVDKIVTFYTVKINQISNETDKNDPEKHRNKGVVLISCLALPRNLFLPLPQQLSVSLFSPLLVDVSQFLRPRPLYKYTGPE